MKAQSAIEYLTTYGWMLIAASIVSGVAFSTISQECPESASGFVSNSITIHDFGTLEGTDELGVVVGNQRPNTLNITEMTFTLDNQNYTVPIQNGELDAGEKGQVNVSGIIESNQCNSVETVITYDRISGGSKVEDIEIEGQMTSNIDFKKVGIPEAPENLNATFTG